MWLAISAVWIGTVFAVVKVMLEMRRVRGLDADARRKHWLVAMRPTWRFVTAANWLTFVLLTLASFGLACIGAFRDPALGPLLQAWETFWLVGVFLPVLLLCAGFRQAAGMLA